MKPPADITPRDFFERWLPEQFGQTDDLGEWLVRVELSGKNGGTWHLAVRGGRLQAIDGGEADVAVVQSVEDWRAGHDLLPAGASPRDALFADAQSRQLFAMLKGVMQFEVTGLAGGTWQLKVAFGRGTHPGEPNATVTVDAETFAAMQAGRMQAPEAYFAGKIQIRGDVNLAMQLGMALLPRMARKPS